MIGEIFLGNQLLARRIVFLEHNTRENGANVAQLRKRSFGALVCLGINLDEMSVKFTIFE